MRAVLLTPQAHRAEVIHILSISFILRWATANANDVIYMEKECARSMKTLAGSPGTDSQDWLRRRVCM